MDTILLKLKGGSITEIISTTAAVEILIMDFDNLNDEGHPLREACEANKVLTEEEIHAIFYTKPKEKKVLYFTEDLLSFRAAREKKVYVYDMVDNAPKLVHSFMTSLTNDTRTIICFEMGLSINNYKIVGL